MVHTLQIVDSVASSPTVRLDLNDGTIWKCLGFDPGVPKLRRAVSSNAMSDGINVSNSQYGERAPRAHLQVFRSSRDLAATQMQLLSRELDRVDNFLKYQQDGSSKPVFFKLFRSEYSGTSDIRGQASAYELDVDFLAQPEMVGLEETLGPFTVEFDPSVSGGGYFDATGVLGDLEAHPTLSWPINGSSAAEWVIAVRRHGTPSAMPFLLQAESMTLGTDASLSADSSDYSPGSGNNVVSINFATPTMVQRLSMADFPTSDSVDARGTYRVFMRYGGSNNTPTTFNVRLGYTSTTLNAAATCVTTSNGRSAIGDADLGLISIPYGADRVTTEAGTTLAVDGVPLTLHAETVSGTSLLKIDYLLFVPADDRCCIYSEGYATGTPDAVLSPDGLAWTRTSGGAVKSLDASTSMSQVVGAPPLLSPNQTNRVVFYPLTSHVLTDDIAVTVKYHPRYLYIRPSAS